MKPLPKKLHPNYGLFVIPQTTFTVVKYSSVNPERLSKLKVESDTVPRESRNCRDIPYLTTVIAVAGSGNRFMSDAE